MRRVPEGKWARRSLAPPTLFQPAGGPSCVVSSPVQRSPRCFGVPRTFRFIGTGCERTAKDALVGRNDVHEFELLRFLPTGAFRIEQALAVREERTEGRGEGERIAGGGGAAVFTLAGHIA